MTAEELIKESEGIGRSVPFCRRNQRIQSEKVLKAFQRHRVALRHFNPSTGYGYGDEGRFVLGDVFACSLGAEAGIVSCATFGNAR
ncbi:MAG: methionine gamma-lyase family protein [Christensenellaceae bacterium]